MSHGYWTLSFDIEIKKELSDTVCLSESALILTRWYPGALFCQYAGTAVEELISSGFLMFWSCGLFISRYWSLVFVPLGYPSLPSLLRSFCVG